MLTETERKLLITAWTSGPTALIASGYTTDQIRAFFEREDVQTEMATLEREFKHAPVFDARAKYQARRGLAQLSPGAIGLLAKAMRGPVFSRAQNGAINRDARGFPILMEAEITPAQLRAAEIVVDAVGGRDGKADGYRGDVQINVLLASDAKITLEPDAEAKSPEQQALSRERMRNAIDRLLLKLPDVQERVRKALEGPAVRSVKPGEPPVPLKRRVLKEGAGGGQKAH